MSNYYDILKRVFKLNVVVFSLFALLFVWTRFIEIRLINYVYSFIVLFITLALGGINCVLLLQCCVKKTFNWLEFINIASISGLLIMPAFYFLEITFLDKDYIWLPVINTLFLFIAVLFFCLKGRASFIEEDNKADQESVTKSYLLFGVIAVLFFITVLLIITSYFPLLEQDPYHWMNKYRELFVDGKLAPLVDRPLFLVLTRIFINTARIDTYAYFKYVLPLLSCLILIPTWLVASRFKSRLHQLAILVIPLASPSTILYQITPMPQMIAIIATSNFIFWLLYSRLSGNRYFYYLAGFSIFLASFYYEMAVIIFLIWISVTIINDRKKITFIINSNKLTVFLLMIILLPYYNFVNNLLIFVIFWINKVYHSILLFQINWLFPAFYENVDQNQMGWPGFLGVSKYYLFYVGPPLLFTAGVFCCFFLFRASFRRRVLRSSVGSPEAVILCLGFVTFFIISDVLPRIANVALLPERAWIFGGIFLSAFVVGTMKHSEDNHYHNHNHYSILLVFLTLISVGAAIYINDLKKYVVPDYQLQSAEWIKNNLSGRRVILSVGNYNLLRFHANSVMYNMPANFYCDKELEQSENLWRIVESTNPVFFPKKIVARQTLGKLENYLTQTNSVDSGKLHSIIDENVNDLKKGIELREGLKKNVFIYYYSDDPRNPYAQRPYREMTAQCFPLVFDTNSDAYERIYSDQDRVIIWRVK
ncbi:MAG: hypothetical protein Q7S57_02505 [bacterium]|nr:hypothetical protein [bacterium]